MTSFVGLDVGTTGVKAVAISPDGQVLASAEEGYSRSTSHLQPSRDPADRVAAVMHL